jgi:Na+/H+ antiporter NhaA
MAYLALAAISAMGFGASLICHVLGWMKMDPPGGKAALALHIGIFMVWIPLVISSNRTMPTRGRGNLEHLLAALPKWTRVAVMVLFAYALAHFALFVFETRKFPRHGVPLYLEVRGFSGHWMMFYGWAMVGFWGLRRLQRKANGGAG